jgi:hypothetical protein
MYLIRLSYEPRAGMTGDAAVAAARELNRFWVGLGMPQMRLLLSPFGPFGAPFVQLDVTVDDLAEAEAALTRIRAQMDPRSDANNPPPGVEILRVIEEPPISEQQVAQALQAAHQYREPASSALEEAQPPTTEATAAALRAQDVSDE